jgi:ABC-type uncharacterized transport system auxiliary subunit
MKNNKIEKIIGILSLVAISMLVSCNEKPAEKEVIIVPTTTVTVEKEAPKKATSIKVSKEGAEIETENVEVVIKK